MVFVTESNITKIRSEGIFLCPCISNQSLHVMHPTLSPKSGPRFHNTALSAITHACHPLHFITSLTILFYSVFLFSIIRLYIYFFYHSALLLKLLSQSPSHSIPSQSLVATSPLSTLPPTRLMYFVFYAHYVYFLKKNAGLLSVVRGMSYQSARFIP